MKAPASSLFGQAAAPSVTLRQAAQQERNGLFGDPRPTIPPPSPPPSALYGRAAFHGSPASGGFVLDTDRIKDSIETSPQVQSFPSNSESEAPTVGIFGPGCFEKPYDSEFEPISTFLSGNAHASAKKTFDLKVKGIKDELPLLSMVHRSVEEDALIGQLERLCLLEDLVKIEELLQV
jgi:hypothetical protein